MSIDQVSNIRQDNFNVYISLHKTFSIKLNLSTYSDENCSEIKLRITCSTKIIKGGVVKGKGATTVQKCGRSRVARFMANAKREPNKILGPTAKFLVRGSRVKPFEADAICSVGHRKYAHNLNALFIRRLNWNLKVTEKNSPNFCFVMAKMSPNFSIDNLFQTTQPMG
jgi:hypothetical protein